MTKTNLIPVTDATIIDAACYLLDNNTTIRDTAAHFGISKSTLWDWFNKRLPNINSIAYQAVRSLLEHNRSLAPSRGGIGKAKKKFN